MAIAIPINICNNISQISYHRKLQQFQDTVRKPRSSVKRRHDNTVDAQHIKLGYVCWNKLLKLCKKHQVCETNILGSGDVAVVRQCQNALEHVLWASHVCCSLVPHYGCSCHSCNTETVQCATYLAAFPSFSGHMHCLVHSVQFQPRT